MLKPKIAVVCRTVGLEYDDRIRKECIALSRYAEVKIFVTFENNIDEEGFTSYGIPYRSFGLLSRMKIKSGKFLLIKALEFFLRVKPYLENYDLVWAHEEYSFMFPLLLGKKKVVWDLHEIPFRFNNCFMRRVFHYIEKNSKLLVHANEQRILYLKRIGLVKQMSKNHYLRNFPDSDFFNSKQEPPDYLKFIDWLNGQEYVYLQGIGVADRLPFNSIASVLKTTNYKVVIIGAIDEKSIIEDLELTYGNEFYNRVWFTGLVNQLAIPAFLSGAKFTLVFYESSDPNNLYCEANRFYQAISFGIPVITGMNPSMSSIVREYKLGLALDGDGSDLSEVESNISILLSNYDFYKSNCLQSKNLFVWSDENLKLEWIR